MDPRLFGEFMGTLVLVLIGNGVVANVVLKKTLGSAAGWLTIVFGYGLGVVAGVFTAIACGSTDAHINPAVTLGFAISSGDFSKFIPYLIAQVLGPLHAALGGNPGSRIEARVLLYGTCHSEHRD
jgi:glycerol uptake facilitator protein